MGGFSMLRVIVLLGTALGLTALAAAAQPAKNYQLVTPKEIDIVATGINERGDIVGFESIEDRKNPDVIEEVPFYARGKDITHLPLLEGYTATSPAGVSDDGLVVGYVSKPISPIRRGTGSSQAFVWDARAGIRGIGMPEGDVSSFASGISRDGRRISGYSVGPNRKRACIWERDGQAWKAAVLPESAQLRSTHVPISGDGRFIAAAEADSPCLWTRDASGRWTREVIGSVGSMSPRAVNDAGTVVGTRYTPDGLSHAIVWSKTGGLRPLAKPLGYVKSEALAVNNRDVIVGMVDGPAGGKLGPNAFVYDTGPLRILHEWGRNFASATVINDRGQIGGILEKKEDEEPADPARKKAQ
jgi:uncharacterized membrane protein